MPLFQRQGDDWLKIGKIFHYQSGVWMPVKSIKQVINGNWVEVFKSEVVVTITQNTELLSVEELFSDTVWTGDVQKRVVIAPTVVIGSDNVFNPAIYINGDWQKKLIIENYGEILGAPGGPNGGPGGDAIISDKPGVILRNFGFLASGGGGGGKGGKGGSGGQGSYTYTTRQPASGVYQTTSYEVRNTAGGLFGNTRTYSWVWAGNVISNSSASSVTVGSATYYRGAVYRQVNDEVRTGSDGDSKTVTHYYYTIYRTYPSTAYTNGGAGGEGNDGGSGRGYEAELSPGLIGFNGVAGGTNAGAGGKGGDGGSGGDWGMPGQDGNTGAKGANGNYGSGVVGNAGAPGGIAGLVYQADKIDLEINTGTILGRT